MKPSKGDEEVYFFSHFPTIFGKLQMRKKYFKHGTRYKTYSYHENSTSMEKKFGFVGRGFVMLCFSKNNWRLYQNWYHENTLQPS